MRGSVIHHIYLVAIAIRTTCESQSGCHTIGSSAALGRPLASGERPVQICVVRDYPDGVVKLISRNRKSVIVLGMTGKTRSTINVKISW